MREVVETTWLVELASLAEGTEIEWFQSRRRVLWKLSSSIPALIDDRLHSETRHLNLNLTRPIISQSKTATTVGASADVFKGLCWVPVPGRGKLKLPSNS